MKVPPTTGIYSLPTETLTDIFCLASAFPANWRTSGLGPAAALVDTELQRVANAPLLVLARACSRWHALAMGHPTFWSDIQVHAELGAPETLETTIKLVNARLDRAGDAPLFISLRSYQAGHSTHPRIFQLLAQHSDRWRKLYVDCSLEGIDTSVLKGRLSTLKTLSLHGVKADKDFFAVAPMLDNISITLELLRSESLETVIRSRQLRVFEADLARPRHVGETISLLPKLPFAAHCILVVSLDRLSPQCAALLMDLPSVTAPMSSFAVLLHPEVDPHGALLPVNQILASLTLPRLPQLLVACSSYPKVQLEWPHRAFLGLCDRTELGRCLKTLCIVEVRITETDLLEVLAVLRALETLEIGDAVIGECDDREDSVALVSDSFLRAMVWKPTQHALVPRLWQFTFVSKLAFCHGLLLNLVTSRLARSSDTPFHLFIHLLPTTAASLDCTVDAALRELAAGNCKHFKYRSSERYIPLTSQGRYS
ncbi:hypothetical protein C8R46DRAFT_1229335 [Mycena filopes]|nr:hypothetical protein C8R46DRAFT_1229335 [Mycena filopes]